MKCRHLFGALAVSLLSLSFCGLATAADSRDTGYTSEPEHIYERSCGYCHGHNVGPILLGRSLPSALIRVMVRNGVGAMPAFRPTEITGDELEALASWIQASEARSGEFGR